MPVETSAILLARSSRLRKDIEGGAGGLKVSNINYISYFIIFHMADLTTLIDMLSGADDAAGGAGGSRNSDADGDAKGAAFAIGGGGWAHRIAVKSAFVNPGVGDADGGFAWGGAWVP